MWAATIDASRVAEHVRPKLVAYQDRCADALDAMFGTGRHAPSVDASAHARLAVIAEIQHAELAGDRRTVSRLAACLADLARTPRGARETMVPTPEAIPSGPTSAMTTEE